MPREPIIAGSIFHPSGAASEKAGAVNFGFALWHGLMMFVFVSFSLIPLFSWCV
jgi:hypothetical protein